MQFIAKVNRTLCSVVFVLLLFALLYTQHNCSVPDILPYHWLCSSRYCRSMTVTSGRWKILNAQNSPTKDIEKHKKLIMTYSPSRVQQTVLPYHTCHRPRHHPQTSLHPTWTAHDHCQKESIRFLSKYMHPPKELFPNWWASTYYWLNRKKECKDWYLMRSSLALSALCLARLASLSSIFFFFHSINNSVVKGVEAVNFARCRQKSEQRTCKVAPLMNVFRKA